ncbi:hypothetical protein AAFF_G00283820 [Aldrovandia affinis]|uniref:Uncharacterized protein n=1 Tax=Aldrovandia affinis TaxID=143900 RepID=A0AAD7TA37_9TELE|nr:hypothetical protein AAFF_G00283820 [Aldrovandia affinis]
MAALHTQSPLQPVPTGNRADWLRPAGTAAPGSAGRLTVSGAEAWLSAGFPRGVRRHGRIAASVPQSDKHARSILFPFLWSAVTASARSQAPSSYTLTGRGTGKEERGWPALIQTHSLPGPGCPAFRAAFRSKLNGD